MPTRDLPLSCWAGGNASSSCTLNYYITILENFEAAAGRYCRCVLYCQHVWSLRRYHVGLAWMSGVSFVLKETKKIRFFFFLKDQCLALKINHVYVLAHWNVVPVKPFCICNRTIVHVVIRQENSCFCCANDFGLIMTTVCIYPSIDIHVMCHTHQMNLDLRLSKWKDQSYYFCRCKRVLMMPTPILPLHLCQHPKVNKGFSSPLASWKQPSPCSVLWVWAHFCTASFVFPATTC